MANNTVDIPFTDSDSNSDSDDNAISEEHIENGKENKEMSDTIKKQYASSFTLVKDFVEIKKISSYIEYIAISYPEIACGMLLEASNAEKKKLSDMKQRVEEKLTKSPLHVLLVANHFYQQWNNRDFLDEYAKKLEMEILSRLALFNYDKETDIIVFSGITNLTEAEEYLMNNKHLVSMQSVDLLTAYILHLYMEKNTLLTKIALNRCINLIAILDEVEECHISPDVSIKLQFAELKEDNKDNIHILREKIILILLCITTAIQQIFHDYSNGPPHEIFNEQNIDGAENESLNEDNRNTDELEIEEFFLGANNEVHNVCQSVDVDNEFIGGDSAVENVNDGNETQTDDESILSDSYSQTGSESFDDICEDVESQNDQQHSMVHDP